MFSNAERSFALFWDVMWEGRIGFMPQTMHMQREDFDFFFLQGYEEEAWRKIFHVGKQ